MADPTTVGIPALLIGGLTCWPENEKFSGKLSRVLVVTIHWNTPCPISILTSYVKLNPVSLAESGIIVCENLGL